MLQTVLVYTEKKLSFNVKRYVLYIAGNVYDTPTQVTVRRHASMDGAAIHLEVRRHPPRGRVGLEGGPDRYRSVTIKFTTS